MGHSVRRRNSEERLVALFPGWRRINLCRHWTAKDLGMTLAAILLVGMVCAPPGAPAARRQDAPQSAPATKPPEAATDQGKAQAAQNPPAPSQTPPATAKTSSGETHTTTPQSHHKKRALPPCDPPAAAQPPASSNPTPADSAAAGTAQTSKTPSPCPPSKVVVRQGGTSEPSIQLAGGPAITQTSNQRDPATQMLDTTEANLKKLAGKQLTANQQDMVSQTRQFVQQSKDAVEAGDLERARTLAWKARVLSEELVKPEK